MIEAKASIFPTKLVPVPRVVEVADLHHTLHGSPPETVELDDVMIVVADLNIQTPDDPLSVRFPLSWKPPAPTQ
jgi:hypothetical protein